MEKQQMTQEEKIKFLAGKIAGAKEVLKKVENPGFKTRVTPKTNKETQYRQEDAVYKQLMESPIVDPTAPIGMEMLQEEIKKTSQPYTYVHKPDPIPEQNYGTHRPTMEVQLIEHIIKKTVEEVLKQLNEQTSINENIQIKIGNKVFGGKLTVLKENKSSK